ncbi:MAG: ribosome silencing factor [candidate division Zixibacteria bacterium]|nr:ribosome silencing factor [candidate division Zixibacteria bacterium]
MVAEKAYDLARKAGELALLRKANEVQILDLRKITSITDYFVICSGDADVQVRAIAETIIEKLKEEDVNVWNVEGLETGRWVLLDFVDVVVHVFLQEAREFYGLERLWGDAPTESIQ